MNHILNQICEKKIAYLEHCKAQKSRHELELSIQNSSSPRSFIKALDASVNHKKYALIAEIKKASPSKGIIRDDFSPSIIAQEYEQAGACCLSVLTETDFFMGSNEDLIIAKKACSLPILRKDFIIDPYQVIETRAIGADCLLLIMAILSDEQALELEACAHSYQLEVLIEIHDEQELARALKLKSPLIGINNRNLKTLQIELAHTEKLAPLIPQDRQIVAESGLKTSEDLKRMIKAGIARFLIGHSLLQNPNILQTTKKLLTFTEN